MVEKEETSYSEDLSTVLVDAIESSPNNTVGATIGLMEEKLVSFSKFRLPLHINLTKER